MTIDPKYSIGDIVVTWNHIKVKVVEIRVNEHFECVEYLLEYKDGTRIWYRAKEILSEVQHESI